MSMLKATLLALSLILAPSVQLAAAEKPVTPTAPKKEATKEAPKSNNREVLLMSVKLGQHWILACSKPDGNCQEFLNQRGGFQASIPSGNKGNDFAPAASPDGAHLAFYSDRDGAVNLWLSDAQGRGQIALTDEDVSINEINPDQDAPIQFSTDSKKLAFLNRENLWICDLNTQELTSLSPDGGVQAFSFSPDNKWITYYHNGSLRRVSLSGQPNELVLDSAADFPTLCYTSDPKSNLLYFFYRGVWSVDTFSKQKTFVVGSAKVPNKIRISPKGDMLSYIALSPDQRPELYLVGSNKKGAGPSDTTLLTLGGASRPFFSLDGKTLYFQRNEGLWSISSAGGEKVRSLQILPCLLATTGMLSFPLPVECAQP
jgi:Tol biopolymer transport system component